jgi:CheY-like chemotaxis protein
MEDEAGPSFSATAGQTVLVVEDDASVRKLIVRVVTSLGYDTREAEDGASALAALETAPAVDLLLTDVVLPNDMSGFNLAKIALQQRPKLKVIFMSGYAHGAVLDQEVAPGATLLSKPFTRGTLATALRDALLGEPSR